MKIQTIARAAVLAAAVAVGLCSLAYTYVHRPQSALAVEPSSDELIRFADARRALLRRDARCLPRGIDYIAAAQGLGLPPGVNAAEELKRVDEEAVRAGCIVRG